MIRPYLPTDQAPVIELLRLNTPKYFDVAEEKDLLTYLQNDAEHYYVIEKAKQVVAAGGINFGFEDGKAARISWDIIHPNAQGKGLGTELVRFRINKIKQQQGVEKIIVRTTQLVHSFYQKNGFKRDKVVPDYWAKGFDLYLMSINLSG